MKKNLIAGALLAAVVLVGGGQAFASHCPVLIKEANGLMATMDQGSEKVQAAMTLVAESDRAHKAGDHAESMKKVEEALSLLK